MLVLSLGNTSCYESVNTPGHVPCSLSLVPVLRSSYTRSFTRFLLKLIDEFTKKKPRLSSNKMMQILSGLAILFDGVSLPLHL